MNDPKHWKGFVRWLAGGFAGAVGVCLLAVIATDPYGNIWFSPPAGRAMLDVNQRWLYPALARDHAIDSAVFGTSTIRLLEPERLNGHFGGDFAQLAMNSATAWEQVQIAELFLRHHPNPRTIILGLDGVWCGNKVSERITSRGFPAWMYDDDPWNDLAYLLNGKTVEMAGRMVSYWLGLKEPNYDRRGWSNFLPPPEQYDIAKVRTGIYGGPEPKRHPAPETPAPGPEIRREWSYPDQAMLADLLAKIPDGTRTILVFVPYHAHLLGHPQSPARAQFDECKSRVIDLARARDGVHVVDFMVDSAMTTTDEHYWDPFHYNLPTARRMADLMAEAVLRGDQSSGEVRILTP